MKKVLFILNDAPYGNEKAYNALRMAMNLQKENSPIDIRVYLLADAVTCAIPNEHTPAGHYNIEKMMNAIIEGKGQVKLCKSCAEARGIANLTLIQGTEIGTLSHLTSWVMDSDKVLTF